MTEAAADTVAVSEAVKVAIKVTEYKETVATETWKLVTVTESRKSPKIQKISPGISKIRTIFEKSEKKEKGIEEENCISKVKERANYFEKMMRSERIESEKSVEKKKRKRTSSIANGPENPESKAMKKWIIRGGKEAVENVGDRETEKEKDNSREKVNVSLVKNIQKRFETETEKNPLVKTKTSSAIVHSGQNIKKGSDTKKIVVGKEKEANLVKKCEILDRKLKIWDKFFEKRDLEEKNGGQNEKVEGGPTALNPEKP